MVWARVTSGDYQSNSEVMAEIREKSMHVNPQGAPNKGIQIYRLEATHFHSTHLNQGYQA